MINFIFVVKMICIFGIYYLFCQYKCSCLCAANITLPEISTTESTPKTTNVTTTENAIGITNFVAKLKNIIDRIETLIKVVNDYYSANATSLNLEILNNFYKEATAIIEELQQLYGPSSPIAEQCAINNELVQLYLHQDDMKTTMEVFSNVLNIILMQLKKEWEAISQYISYSSATT